MNAKISSKERVRLIHQGNALFNQKHYLMAEKVFRTVEYRDGLVRLGQIYFDQKEYFRAAELFRLGKSLRGEYNCYLKLGLIEDLPDFKAMTSLKSMDSIINQKLAQTIQAMLKKYPD